MKVILTMDVEEVGSRGEQVDVAAGFARNYLLPRGEAVPATPGNVRMMEEEQRLTDVRGQRSLRDAEKVGSFLEATDVFATLKIGREGRAFGSVTSQQIALLLKQAGMEVDRRKIRLPKPIRRLGVMDVALNIHPDVETVVTVFVDREGGSREGAQMEQEKFEAAEREAEEVRRLEAEERAVREKEAEEIMAEAVRRAEERKVREEEEAAWGYMP
ncbi:MAG: 50S ribosomal protein L9 [Gemmatimonadota bacterium]|nr:50S ribosomal protein L9 [Gemmatimonadota bacterium]